MFILCFKHWKDRLFDSLVPVMLSNKSAWVLNEMVVQKHLKNRIITVEILRNKISDALIMPQTYTRQYVYRSSKNMPRIYVITWDLFRVSHPPAFYCKFDVFQFFFRIFLLKCDLRVYLFLLICGVYFLTKWGDAKFRYRTSSTESWHVPDLFIINEVTVDL